MRAWRLLPLRIDDPAMSMAIEEALLRLNAAGKSPNSVRFWRWATSAVSIGCFQQVEDEVDLEAAERHGIEIVGRITGGGAVFHDREGELTYGVVCKQSEVPDDILKSYELICSGLVRGFERLGIHAELRPLGSEAPARSRRSCPVVQVAGKKISGSAQTRRWGSVLQHGTLLISPDFVKMFEVLRAGPTKDSVGFMAWVYGRLTTLERELSRRPSIEEVRDAMRAGFEKAFGIELIEGEFTREELELAARLKPKYSSPSKKTKFA